MTLTYESVATNVPWIGDLVGLVSSLAIVFLPFLQPILGLFRLLLVFSAAVVGYYFAYDFASRELVSETIEVTTTTVAPAPAAAPASSGGFGGGGFGSSGGSSGGGGGGGFGGGGFG